MADLRNGIVWYPLPDCNKQYSSISFPAPNNMQLSWVVSAVISSKDRFGKATKAPHAMPCAAMSGRTKQ
ncbi:N-terminal acetyltransferase A complex catalytic subunit ard1 [Fusarium oxysporum f. sp. albedinis]|nr:N-terminal acetyltransferase A complex catalytic subunit ard1 [Fusarium oxysporum f. sp. albedinis]